MTTLGALFYADVRSFVNQLREIRRSPGRAILWAGFVLLVLALIVLRILNASRRGAVRATLFGSPTVRST